MKRKGILTILVLAMFLIGSTGASYGSGSSTVHLKYTSISIQKGSKVSNRLIGAQGKIVWKSSNKKIASVSSKGVIKAKKAGKCTITAKHGKQMYKCKVKVIRAKPDFDAKIVAVGLKKGKTYIKVRFRNNSGKSLLIQKNAVYNDYTEVDYSIKLKKDTKIKGHSRNTLTFINYGKHEIWNHAGRQDPDIFAEALESDLYYKFRFDGKKYTGNTFWTYDEDEDGNRVDYYVSNYGRGIPTNASKR